MITPLRNIVARGITINTIAQLYADEFVSSIMDNVNSIEITDNKLLMTATTTALFFAIATYHNLQMVYNKKLYTISFSKNVKLVVLIIMFIFAKNVEMVF
jgi:hypothetical protein